MKTISATREAYLAAPARTDHLRVELYSSGYIDMGSWNSHDWVISATISETIDGPTATATVQFWRERGSDSLSPLVSGSVLAIATNMRIFTATLPEGLVPQYPSDYTLSFIGTIDDVDIGSGNKSRITVRARDLGGGLQDAFIQDVTKYGSGGGKALEDVIDDILGDWASSHTLTTVGTPSWSLLEYKQVKEPIMSAIRKLTGQIGWDVRYRWSNISSDYELTLYEPARAGGIVRTFGLDDYFAITQASVSRRDVRNKIDIIYRTSPSGPPLTYSAPSAGSSTQTKYGVRYCQITESSTSNIDSLAEATVMGDSILSDLEEPLISHGAEMPFFFAAMLGDYYRFAANHLYDSNQDLAVVGIEHRFGDGKARTILTCRGVPSGGTDRWLESDARPGLATASDNYSDVAPTSVATASNIGTVIVTYADPRSATPPVPDWRYTECYCDTNVDPVDLVARGKQTRFEIGGLIPGETYYTKLKIIDDSGNVSTEAISSAQEVSKVSTGDIDLSSNMSTPIPNSEFGQQSSAAVPPDNWTVSAGSWSATGVGNIYLDTTDAITGANSLKFEGEPTDPGGDHTTHITSDKVPLREGRVYLLRAIVKRPSGDASDVDMRFAAVYYDKDEALISAFNHCTLSGKASGTDWTLTGGQRQQLIGAAGWYLVEKAFIPPTTTAFMAARIGKKRVGGGGGSNDGHDILVDSCVIVPHVEEVQTYLSGDQTIGTGAWDQVELDTETIDTAAAFAVGTYTWTAPYTARYRIIGRAVWDNQDAAAMTAARLTLGGSPWKYGPPALGTNAWTVDTNEVDSGEVELAIGDTVTLEVKHASAGAQDLTSGVDATSLHIVQLGGF